MSKARSSTSTTMAERRRSVLYMRLHSALRTALACTIIGCTTLYSPAILRKHITFPAFAYVVAVMIVVSDAYLGAAIRGCWHALFATFQVVPLSMLTIYAVEQTTEFSPVTAALAVAGISFLVALPKSTDLLCKRVGFGQLVLVFISAVIHRDKTTDYNAHRLPLGVAVSTALGAGSALFAMLLPYPRLAHTQVRILCGLYAENGAERMNLYLNALSAKNRYVAAELLAKSKPLDEAGNKLLQSIILIQGGIIWERPWMRITCPELVSPGDRLQGIQTSMRGMRIALENRLCLNEWDNEDIKDVILDASTLINLRLQQARCLLSMKSTVPELETNNMLKFPYNTIMSITKDLSAGFFLSCVQQLIGVDSTMNGISKTVSEENSKQQNTSFNLKVIFHRWIPKCSRKRFRFATRCSLSLGMSVLTGLMFDKQNGYWTGLVVAISLVEGRQALFTSSNARAQGTALGSVYGILGCFVFQKYPEIRFLALLPWIFFTGFLGHSRMYGPSGGISAIIGALLILGRNNYGDADEFAIHRLTEAIIGLCCLIAVELLIQPNRASTLVKRQLYRSLLTLEECINQLVLASGSKDKLSIKLTEVRQKERDFMGLVQGLKKLINEAEMEPCFWYIPFHGSIYKNVQNSLSNTANLLSYLCFSLEYLSQFAGDNNNGPWKEVQVHIDSNMNLCKETIGSSLGCLENLIIQKPRKNAIHTVDKEISPSWIIDILQATNGATDHLLQLQQQPKKVEESPKVVEGDKENKGKMLISLSVWGFCSSYLLRETENTETLIKELLHWE